MRTGFILLVVCAFAAAMVPRDRRALNSEELLRISSTTTTSKPTNICAPQTPCAWSTYKTQAKIIDMNIQNTYCICSPDTVCQIGEDDSSANVFIHRCRPPVETGEDTEEEAAES